MVGRLIALGVAVLGACGDDGGGNQRNDAAVDSRYFDAPGSGGVSGVAHMLHGAMVPAAVNAIPPVPAPPSDGHWYVTPDEAKVTIERINFAGANGGNSSGADLTNCSLTFSKSTPSLSSLLDCPFEIAPGTYSGMTVHINGTFDVKVADATNGIYTDPASSTKLSTTAPAGGPAFVAYTRPLGGTGVEQAFATPLTVNEGDTISLAVVLDAIQTLRVTVSNSGSTLAFGDMNQIPVNIFPTLTTPGIARYLTTSGTAESYNDDSVLANIVRVYYAAGGGQPVYLFTEQTAGAINGCSTPAPAYPVDPAMSTPLTSGGKLGGWLGRDSTQTTCWAVPNDIAYATYRAYFTLGNAAAVGDTATLSCDATTAPTPPTSGSTYASGCPSITADATATLTLVAE
jgi:hypothetical protein